MVETAKTCSECLKPKRSDSSGFITQYIAVCRCDASGSGTELNLPNFCERCGKNQQAARSGSLTQWILRSGKCNCIKQDTGNTQPPPDTTSDTIVSQEELVVPAEKFPLNRYKPLARLGTGASGTVYLAQDRVLPKKVAVKILHQLNAVQLMQFQEEARTTSKLNHTNIIAILDFGPTDDGAPYMVLEYIDKAVTLERYINDKGPLSIEDAVKVLSDVCDGLSYAHEQGVFHRDLKPTNILLIGSGNLSAKLIDFGVAKVKEETQEPTIYQGRTIAGTPGYMAPEQTIGTAYSEQADIYSLGAVLFEALTGEQPFSGHSALEIIAMQANSSVPSLAEVSGISYPDELEKVVVRCMDNDPRARFESADEVKAALEKVLTAASNLVASQSETSPSRSRRTSSSLTVTIVGMVLFILLVGGTFLRLFDPKSTDFKINSKEEFSSLALPRRDAEAAESLEINGFKSKKFSGAADVDFDSDVIVKQMPAGICYLEHCAADDSLAVVKGREDIVDLRIRAGGNIHGKGLSNLEGLPLKSLSIVPSEIDDQGLKYLPIFPKLAQLSLPKSKIEGSTLRVLEKQPKLTYISLGNSDLTDEGLGNLTGCMHLREIDLIGCKKITGTTLSSLKALPNLRNLQLSGTNVNPEFLGCLSTFPSLSNLRLDGLKLDRKSKQMLANSKYSTLSLKNIELSEEDIQRIVTGNQNLRVLALGHRPTLSLHTLKCLVDSNIVDLTLEGITLPHEAFPELAKSKNLTALDLLATGINYKEAFKLLSQKKIQRLTVSGPSLSSDDFQRLLKQFPRKQLNYQYVNEPAI